jgi:hypothetical protein
LKKCCFFVEWWEIQHDHPGFWLAEAFFYFFPDLMFLIGILISAIWTSIRRTTNSITFILLVSWWCFNELNMNKKSIRTETKKDNSS